MEKIKRALTAEDLFQLEVLSDPQIAPNGNGYAFVSTTVNEQKEYDSHLYFQGFDHTEARQWTFGHHKNSHPRFSPDGKKVVFQSDRSGVSQLWLFYTDGGEARQLTTFKYGVENPNWSKDGKSILFGALMEPSDSVHHQQEQTMEERQQEQKKVNEQPFVIKRLKHKLDADGFYDDKRKQIISYDIECESFTQLTTANANHHFEDISPNGEHILYSANLDADADYEETIHLYLLNGETKEITKLTKGKGTYCNARFSAGGKKIACFGHEFAYHDATINELYVFDIDSGERSCLSSEWDLQLDDFMIGDTRLGQSTTGPIWSTDEEHLYFIATHFGATGLYGVHLQGELTEVYKSDSHLFGFSYHEQTNRFVLGISTPTMPGNFYQLASDGLDQLTTMNVFLEDVALSEPQMIKVASEDGLDIQGWLLRPYDFKADKKYPFILEIHGGPHAMYGQTFFHEMQLLAAKGYVVLYTNPRGSHGYGQQFSYGCFADYGGKDYVDLMVAVDYAVDKFPFIDVNRLGVTGGSYGGFMTNWIIGHTNRFKVAVTQRSISNWLSLYGVSDIGYFYTKWELGVSLLEDPEKLWDFSPLKYAESIETPLLILHSEKDLNVGVEQSEQLFITLKHLHKEVEFIRFPGENHELSRSGRPKLRLERLNHICRWFQTYL